MLKNYLLLFSFLLFFFNCDKKLKIKESSFVDSFGGFNNVFFVKKNSGGYILNSLIMVPENKTLIIDSGVEIKIKNGGKIINNGVLIFGQNKKNDSLFFYNSDLFNGDSYPYNVFIKSKKNDFFISGNGDLFFYGVFLKNISINYNGNIKLYNSLFINSDVVLDSSRFFVENSFFEKNKIVINNSIFNINNSLFINSSDFFYINNSKNILINNCFVFNNKGFVFDGVFGGNILNNVFFKNEKSIDFYKKNQGFFKIYNNLIVENNIVINRSDSSNLFLLNNTFDRNNFVINSSINYKSIISKNNIFSYNDSINNFIFHSYCLSNTDVLNGYFNIYGDPLYVDIINYNYYLDKGSKARRSGNNNINLGANIKYIYYNKYLK